MLMGIFQVPDPNPLINCKTNILILLQRSIMLADLDVTSEGDCFYSTTDPEVGGGEVIFYSKKTSTTSISEKQSSVVLFLSFFLSFFLTSNDYFLFHNHRVPLSPDDFCSVFSILPLLLYHSSAMRSLILNRRLSVSNREFHCKSKLLQLIS